MFRYEQTLPFSEGLNVYFEHLSFLKNQTTADYNKLTN